MRLMSGGLSGLLVFALASPALGGITVTSYYTLAQVNGYAPVSQAQFFEEQRLDNMTPATASVSGDWMGTNSSGSAVTWHYVGSAQASSTTTFNANSLTVTAAGSFEYTVDTTAGFVDPGGVTVYRPGAAANYEGFFSADVPTTYALLAQLNLRGRVRLNSLSGVVVFDERNSTSTPLGVSFAGTIPPGEYQVRFTTGLGAPNLPNGANHFEASGSYEDVVFTVQVPEPGTGAAYVTIGVIATARRKRCVRAA